MRRATLFLVCGLLLSGWSTPWGEQPSSIASGEYLGRLDPVSDLYQNLLRESPDTLQAFTRLQHFLLERQRYSDLLWLADMLVNKGELKQASELLQTLLVKMPRQTGEIRFRIAEIYYYQGKFPQTLDLCQRLTALSTAEGCVNDALARMVFIRENLTPVEPLTIFAATEFLLRQQKYPEALIKLDQLKAEFPQSILADESLLLESAIREEMSEFQSAIAALRRLLSEYPQSSLCAKAQKRLGEIYEEKLQDYPAAEREYQLLLLHCPESILASEIRGKLQKLRAGGQAPPF